MIFWCQTDGSKKREFCCRFRMSPSEAFLQIQKDFEVEVSIWLAKSCSR